MRTRRRILHVLDSPTRRGCAPHNSELVTIQKDFLSARARPMSSGTACFAPTYPLLRFNARILMGRFKPLEVYRFGLFTTR